MLYKIVQDKNCFDLNPGLLAVPKFAELTDQQMKFVLLLCDPSKDNPIKTLTGRDRREQSARLSGYKFESDGKRLDKNGRNLVYGKIASVEAAIEEFRLLHYNQHQHNKEALKKQITEIREFLESDKKIPLIHKGKIVVNAQGEEIYTTDQKALKLAVELGVKLPDLEKAYKELEAAEPEEKFEGLTYTAADFPDEALEQNSDLNAIEMFHSNNQKRE